MNSIILSFSLSRGKGNYFYEVIELVTFCPYFAKRFGLHEAIIYQNVSESLKHSYDYSHQKYWIKLVRFNWINDFFFLKEYEYEQAIENLVKCRIFEYKDGKYTINENICN